MDRKLGGLIFVVLVAGCQQAPPAVVTYASYEDCILGELNGGHSNLVAREIARACKHKHPKAPLLTPVDHDPFAGAPEAPRRLTREMADAVFANAPQATPPPAIEFGGYPCTDDCSGHKAGYAWAVKKGITDPADCPTRTRSFMEGCLVLTEEQATAE